MSEVDGVQAKMIMKKGCKCGMDVLRRSSTQIVAGKLPIYLLIQRAAAKIVQLASSSEKSRENKEFLSLSHVPILKLLVHSIPLWKIVCR